jgi:hypothetical protein
MRRRAVRFASTILTQPARLPPSSRGRHVHIVNGAAPVVSVTLLLESGLAPVAVGR